MILRRNSAVMGKHGHDYFPLKSGKQQTSKHHMGLQLKLTAGHFQDFLLGGAQYRLLPTGYLSVVVSAASHVADSIRGSHWVPL